MENNKLWGGEVRRIEIYRRDNNERIRLFYADDAISVSPKNTFYLKGEEMAWYDERQCYYKSFAI